MLVKKVGDLQGQGLIRNDLLAAWVSHRIQTLQSRVRLMWVYSGNDDPTRGNPNELDMAEFT